MMKRTILLVIGVCLTFILACNCQSSRVSNFNERSDSSKINNICDSFPSTRWLGKYEGYFLRLEGESADPRGWGTIEINVVKGRSELYIYSYLEEINVELDFVKEEKKSISFELKDSITNKIITLKEVDEGFEMECELLNYLLDKKELVEMLRVDQE